MLLQDAQKSSSSPYDSCSDVSPVFPPENTEIHQQPSPVSRYYVVSVISLLHKSVSQKMSLSLCVN